MLKRPTAHNECDTQSQASDQDHGETLPTDEFHATLLPMHVLSAGTICYEGWLRGSWDHQGRKGTARSPEKERHVAAQSHPSPKEPDADSRVLRRRSLGLHAQWQAT